MNQLPCHAPSHGMDAGASASVGVHENLFENICRSVSFALVATDPHLNIIFWNDMAARMFHAAPAQMIGKPAIGLFPASVRETAQTILTAAQQGRAGDLEFAQPVPDQKSTLLTAVIAPIRSPEGTHLGVSISLRDITQRRELTRKLARGRRMASLGQMAGGVAHHFNSILGGAMTRLEFVLSMMKPGDRFYKDLERILDAIGRAGRISGQLLTFAEGDHEPGSLGDLAGVIHAFIAEITPDLTQRNIRVVANISPIPDVQAESRRMRAVLGSLTQNAIDAMPSGGELRIELSRDDDHALLVVGDTGSGIPEDKLERVFEPFFTTKGSLGGGAGKATGLSLSVVHGFVTDMGGRIEVSSGSGKGTRFEIRLPLKRPGPRDDTPSQPQPPG